MKQLIEVFNKTVGFGMNLSQGRYLKRVEKFPQFMTGAERTDKNIQKPIEKVQKSKNNVKLVFQNVGKELSYRSNK